MSNPALYTITVLIWGSTWFALEFQLGDIEPAVSIAYRYLLAAALMFAWARLRGLNMRFGPAEHGWFLLLGLTLFCLNYMLAYHAQVYITSALSAIAFSSMLWMNILLSRVFFGVRAAPRVLFGAALGIVGIVVLFAPQIGEVSLDDEIMIGSSLAILGAVVASIGNMASQRAQKLELPVIQSNAWGMLYGAALTSLYATVRGFEFGFDTSPGYVISLGYLSIFGSVVAFWAYLTLLGRIGAHKAGYAVVMFPVVALILSMTFEGLAMDWPIIVGVVLVIAGNLFVLKGTRQSGHIQAAEEPER
ncbi:MAG: EamA family transporter [Woeseiaceae bacterium]|nr:EamA family transporter [Woeseiaceae bacterium]